MTNEVKQELTLESVSLRRRQLLDVREPWRSSRLIERVRQLIPVDHSCSCQKLFNTVIWDLKDKLSEWGEEFVYKVAFVTNYEDRITENPISGLSTTELLNLSYKSKLLSFEQWTLLTECYQIRCKLEHEDLYYEVTQGETEKFFDSCINEVLSVEKSKLTEYENIKSISGVKGVAIPSRRLVESFSKWNKATQIDTILNLVSIATDSSNELELIKNSKVSLIYFKEKLSDDVKISIASMYSQISITKINAELLETLKYTGVLRFVEGNVKSKFFDCIYKLMTEIGADWFKGLQHIEILQSFIELGSLNNCPEQNRTNILIWLALTYIGQEDGKAKYVSDRDVFFNKEASSIIQKLIKEAKFITDKMIDSLHNDKEISPILENSFIIDRFSRFVKFAKN